MKQQTESTTNKQTFLERFRDLFNEKGCSQEELGKAIGAARSTVATWLDGRTAPNAYMVKAMAEYFSVSADYLLCISDTRSSDVNVKVAMEYTGLSEDAVEWLHIGLDDYTIKYNGVGLSDKKKKENWDAASELIKNRAFSDMIYHLKVVSQEAYWGKILDILCDKYANFDIFEENPRIRYSPKDNRDIVEANYTDILTAREPREAEEIRSRVAGLDDLALSLEVNREHFLTEERKELHQFQAAKAFNRYMDQRIMESIQKAEQQLAQPEM